MNISCKSDEKRCPKCKTNIISLYKNKADNSDKYVGPGHNCIRDLITQKNIIHEAWLKDVHEKDKRIAELVK